MKHTSTQVFLLGLLAAVTFTAAVGCGDDDDTTDRGGIGGSSAAGASATGGNVNRGGGSSTVSLGGKPGQGGSATAGVAGQSRDGEAGTAGTAGGFGLAGNAGAPSGPTAPPVTCTVVADKTKPIAPESGRKVYCAIDLGSNNSKLQTLSMLPGQFASFKNERQCRSKTGFGAIVFDSATQTSMPLPPVQIDHLITVMKEFQRLCALDGGTMVGAEATQWARDATNMSEVKVSVKASTSLEIEVLSPETEGLYGYVAATRNSPERLALDTGSNSFQLSWWTKGSAGPSAVSVPFGYVRGSATYYPANSTETYAAARQRHEADIKAKLEAVLGTRTPPTSLAQLKQSIADGNVKSQVFVLGQDGAMQLAVSGALRDATTGTWLSSSDAYKARVAQETPKVDPTYGEIMSVLLPADLNNFFTTIMTPESFLALRTDPIRSLYGESALSNAALLDTLVKELGVTAIVSVPQETPTGYILAKVQ